MKQKIEDKGFVVSDNLSGWITAFRSDVGFLRADSLKGLYNLITKL